jgi:hypothetical protein
MNSKRRILICLAAALLTTAGAQAESPAYYLFQAAPLGFRADIDARFEVRSEHAVLARHNVQVHLGATGSLVIPIPALSLPADRAKDWQLLVFANGLLLDDFDRASFVAYQRQLSVTHAAEIAALERPGSKPSSELKIDCGEPSPCGGGCRPSEDYDCDGVRNSLDNCTDNYNPGQANCDGDNYGDVCDGTNGIFQNTIDVMTCLTDKDLHFGYFDFEHHVERRLFDISSCNAPDRWNRWIEETTTCAGVIPDGECCENGLGNSIEAVGDDVGLWCGSQRDEDHCH